jgi:hypothetical protein
LPGHDTERISRKMAVVTRPLSLTQARRGLVAMGLLAAGFSCVHQQLLPSRTLQVRTDSGAATLSVEVAADEHARTVGLMGRPRLAPDTGMVFVFDEPRTGGFWMKNTLIPLSIAFLGSVGSDPEDPGHDPVQRRPLSPVLPRRGLRRSGRDEQGLVRRSRRATWRPYRSVRRLRRARCGTSLPLEMPWGTTACCARPSA